jgi:hypothetical protein
MGLRRGLENNRLVDVGGNESVPWSYSKELWANIGRIAAFSQHGGGGSCLG